jgi:hypothetical protein
VESLQSEWWPGEPLLPLVYGNDPDYEIVNLPALLFTNPPLITECINTSNTTAASVNQKILEALRQGAQSIILRTASSAEPYNAAWTNGVFRDMISVAIEPVMIRAEDLTTLQGDHKDMTIRIARKDNSRPLSEFISLFDRDHSALDSLRFVYHFPSAGLWDQATRKTINGLLGDLSQWIAAGYDTDTFFGQCILLTEADKVYFKHIIQTRVLNLLWLNLREHFSGDRGYGHGHHLECHIETAENEHPDHFLIRASMSALAASLGGTQSLCIHHAHHADVPQFYEHIHRNLHHLLQLESGMYKGVDPLAGAYAIDYHTRQWTSKIWDGLELDK